MMKRFLIGMVISVGMFVGTLVYAEATDDDYAVFTYEITNIDGSEINGVALDNKSFDNAGVFLLQGEIKPTLAVGDVIAVSYRNGVLDDIVDVVKIK